MRLLDKNKERLQLETLGMAADTLSNVDKLITRPHGIFLVTGPTGSGKSTTLYAALARIDSNALNIMTVEDPVEYEIPGLSQTQVNSKIDTTFGPRAAFNFAARSGCGNDRGDSGFGNR